MKRSQYALLEGFMLRCAVDSAHDREHIYRVLHQALAIAKTEPTADTDVLIAACLLHDICRADQFADPTVCHARAGAEKAHAFLLEQGFGPDFSRHVSDCIRTHRFRKSDPPATIEAKILFDADKLDVTGALGVARTLVYQGTTAQPLYARRPDGSVWDGADAPESFLREYHFKLERLYDRFCTPEAARIAAGRQEAARRFYEALAGELGFCDRAAQALEKLRGDGPKRWALHLRWARFQIAFRNRYGNYRFALEWKNLLRSKIIWIKNREYGARFIPANRSRTGWNKNSTVWMHSAMLPKITLQVRSQRAGFACRITMTTEGTAAGIPNGPDSSACWRI